MPKVVNTVRIPINRRDTQPIYLQIRNHFSRLIQSGTLQPRDRLPSIRALAKSVQVNKLTVVEAYSILEADGLICARQGAGYYVSDAKLPAPPCQQCQSEFGRDREAVLTQQPGNSFVEQVMTSVEAANEHPEAIDLSGGFPAMADLEDLQRIARRAVKQVADKLFNYSYPQGLLVLRQQIAQLLLHLGLEVSPDRIIVTAGSAQGLSLAMHHYLKPGDWVIVESPCYHGALAVLQHVGARAIGIPMTAEGMNLELLAQFLESHRPKLIYTISTLHNPTGLTSNLEHRAQLLALAERYNCPILEDNAYEGLNFEPVPAPIKALDRCGLVTYASTFSKTLMPGLRVGYLVATGEHYRALLESKLLHDLHSSTVSQAIVSEFLGSGHYRRHLQRLHAEHMQRRNAMLQAMETHFPATASWTVPKGGLFLWVQLPAEIPLDRVCRRALEQQVVVAPGTPFFPGGEGGYNAMRLNFSHPPEAIERGIAILGAILQEYSSSSLDLRAESLSVSTR